MLSELCSPFFSSGCTTEVSLWRFKLNNVIKIYLPFSNELINSDVINN